MTNTYAVHLADGNVEAAHGRRFEFGPGLDGLVRGALSIGFLALAFGGFVTERFFHLAYSDAAQWRYALAGSAIGAVWGFARGNRHQPK